MLLYLPEKLYKFLENDEKYKSMVDEITSYVFCYDNTDYLQVMYRYENTDEKIQELQNYIRSVLPKEKLMELELSFNDNLEQFEKDFDKMDVETKLYWLCEVNGGDMSPTPEFNVRNNKFLRIYRNHVLPNPSNYSEFLHCMYYSKLVYNKIFEMINDEKTFDNVLKFNVFENEIFEKILKFSDLESFKHIMYSKREQMYVLFHTFFGQFCQEEVMEFISRCIFNTKFKYNEFTYFRLLFNTLCFNTCVDRVNISGAKSYLNNIINMINFAFNNKKKAIKSLNHYNNAFIDEFINHSKFIVDMVSEYMPKLSKKWDFINNEHLTDLERRFFNDELNSVETQQLSKYIRTGNIYGNEWVKLSQPVLELIDKL